jgi:hypothetical protein
MTPTSPDCMDVHPFGDIDDQLDIGIVVVVRATGHFHVLIRHSDVVCIRLQIFWRGHHRELDGPFVAERLVGPFSYGADLFDCGNTVVGNEHLQKNPVVSELALRRHPHALHGNFSLTEVMTE